MKTHDINHEFWSGSISYVAEILSCVAEIHND